MAANYHINYGANYDVSYHVDLVFCIDITGSMRPVIDLVKNNALRFYDDVQKNMERKGKKIDQMRIRVIAFGDYIASMSEGTIPMMTTDFFKLPEQQESFRKSILALDPYGGGDEPEDGLEALAYAMRSDWDRGGVKRRHIIVVWTDASTHELGFGRACAAYPPNMAKDFDELTEWWGDEVEETYMDHNAKRLLLFAPKARYWTDISANWEQTIHFQSEAGNGLQEVDYDLIIDTIASSI